MTILPNVTLTTDGAARGNPGPGGWAAILEAGGKTKLLVGEEPQPTTNNAMELRAVIGGLEALKQPCAILLRADSQYVLNGIARLQAQRGLPEKNRELWARLQPLLIKHQLRGEWVKGHSGDTRNEQVDQASNLAAARAYAAAEAAHTPAQTADAWTLALLSPAAGRPVQWAVISPVGRRAGSQAVSKGVTQPTAIYHALVAALEAAAALPNAAQASLVVRSNYELIVKQGRGEWKVKQPEQQPLAAQALALRDRFAGVRFDFAPTAEVAGLLEQPV
ncbi:MAG: reverse transcriptase-like protein [Roseiflexaceae bacterium]|nr:reverse transcriptase-like protein [Roseiflexaceae bacterium]